MEELKIKNLYDLTQSIAGRELEKYEYPWEVLPHIEEIILKIGAALPEDEYIKRGDDIWIHRTAHVFDSAYIKGPCIIGADTEVRQCAFIRGKALVGEHCVVGNSTELKNVILFNVVQVPHYNYVGDSILGYHSHMGAGSITSNVKSDKTLVTIKLGDQKIETGCKKMGAMLGNYVEVGCNSVLNPGTVIGQHTNVYPLSMVRGYVPDHSIFKKADNIAAKHD